MSTTKLQDEVQVIEMVEPVTHQAPALIREQAVQSAPTINPAMSLLEIAIKSRASLDEIDRLITMQQRLESYEARKAYVADMALFKTNPPEIFKDKKVGFENKDGSFTGYKHATIGKVTSSILVGLAQHGFSHRWDTQQLEGGQIKVTCIITHKLGHSETTSLQGSRDDSGKKNNIQQMASTITYFQRYTLLAATGLATQDQMDDDGAGSGSGSGSGDDHVKVDPSDMKHISDVPEKKQVPEVKTRFYTDSDFAINSPKWKSVVMSGKKTPAQIIANVETKAPLSHAHKNEIRSWATTDAAINAGEYIPE